MRKYKKGNLKENKKIILLGLIFIITLIGTVLITLVNDNRKYTVKIVSQDGELLQEITVKKGENISKVLEPEKDGYIFVSWLKDGVYYDEDSPIYEDITITPNYTETPDVIKNYTVTFNFGEEVKKQTIKEGNKITKPDDPEKEKHKFLGWYVGDTLFDFDTIIDKDIVLMAKFEKNILTITYELNGGSGIKTEEIEKGSLLNKPKEPTKFGYHFDKWTNDDQEFNFNIKIEEDITLKAEWIAIEYVKVVFNSDGGNVINNQMIEKGSKIEELPIPKKEGYTFKYWSLDGYEFDKNMIIENDIELIAIYEDENDLTNN